MKTLIRSILLLALISVSAAAQTTNSFAIVSWDASSSTNVVGYRIYLYATGVYTPGAQVTFSLATTTGATDQATAASTVPGIAPTNALLSGIVPSLTYCVYATSVSQDWIESTPSNIAVYQFNPGPAAPSNMKIRANAVITTTITNQVTITLP